MQADASGQRGTAARQFQHHRAAEAITERGDPLRIVVEMPATATEPARRIVADGPRDKVIEALQAGQIGRAVP